jgi:hypothetical protein
MRKGKEYKEKKKKKSEAILNVKQINRRKNKCFVWRKRQE